jgi:hypothetical protein
LSIISGPTVMLSPVLNSVVWTTNLASSSTVHYGLSAVSLGSSRTISTMVTKHTVSLSLLRRHTTYYYTVTSSEGGATVTSSVKSFLTP